MTTPATCEGFKDAVGGLPGVAGSLALVLCLWDGPLRNVILAIVACRWI